MQDLRSSPFLAQCPGVSHHGCAHRPLRQRMRQGLARCFSVSCHASQKRMRALRYGSLRAFIQINDRADFGVLVRVGYFARGPVIAIAKVLEMGADLVGHLKGIERRMGGEEAAVVGGDVQAGIGPITNCSLSFWKRPSTASATLASTSTCRSREKVEVSGDSVGPVPERWELWELWEL